MNNEPTQEWTSGHNQQSNQIQSRFSDQIQLNHTKRRQIQSSSITFYDWFLSPHYRIKVGNPLQKKKEKVTTKK